MLKFILFVSLFFVVFVVLPVLVLFIKLFSKGASMTKSFRSASTHHDMNNPNNDSGTYGSTHQDGEKVFDKNEGEYVDFVEIKEEEK